MPRLHKIFVAVSVYSEQIGGSAHWNLDTRKMSLFIRKPFHCAVADTGEIDKHLEWRYRG